MSRHSEHTLVADDGVEVFYQRWLPAEPGDVRATVVVVHGASEHSSRYARFAGALNGGGYAVYALDHRGHGRTVPSTGPGQLGPGGAAAMLADVGRLVAIAAGEQPGLPVVLFGHSLGSMIAITWAEVDGAGIAGLALSGCPGPMDGIDQVVAMMDGAVEAGMADMAANSLSGYNTAFEPARTPYDWLSRDPDEVDKYIADPLCGDDNPLTFGYYAQFLRATGRSMQSPGVDELPRVPVLLVAGELDPVSNMAAGVRALEKNLRDSGLDVTARYYPEARHEVLNETNRDEVTASILEWLDQTISAAE